MFCDGESLNIRGAIHRKAASMRLWPKSSIFHLKWQTTVKVTTTTAMSFFLPLARGTYNGESTKMWVLGGLLLTSGTLNFIDIPSGSLAFVSL